jgi:thiol-disulfide isomerase/thioredoxin
MYKLILTCLVTLCFFSCKQKIAENKSSKIRDKKDSVLVIINQTKNTREQFKYIDYFGNSQLEPFSKTDTLFIKTTQPIVAYSTSTGDFSDLTYYTLSPPDTIYLKMNGEKEVLTSKNPALQKKINLMSKFLFNVSRNYSRTSDFPTALKSISDFYLNKKKIIEGYKDSVDDKAYKEANEIVNYDKLANILTLYTQFNKKDDTIINPLDKADAAAWNYLTFRNVIGNYNAYINKVYHINSAVDFNNFIREKLPAGTQDYAIFCYLTSYKPTDKNKLDTLNQLVTAFNKSAIHKDLANNLSLNLEKYNTNFKTKDSKGIELLSTVNDKPVSLDELIDQNKGKIIYLDFWATWCGPCLAQMPASSTLLNKYQKTKARIVFLYLSQDENMAAWKTKSNNLEIAANESFIILKNAAFGAFLNKYHLKFIPRYMILGKKGEMIEPDALRPDDPKLKVLLGKLLK